jgi:YfiH family protein
MINIQPAFSGSDLISGMTLVDTHDLPWPGTSFSISESADTTHVERSYEVLSVDIGVSRERIATVHQVHGDRCVEVTDVKSCTSVRSEQADALVTAVPGIVLGVKLADCCGVLLHDPVRHVVAAIHSGWRGTTANITARTVALLAGRYGSVASELQAWLSPCASGRVYEVGTDVYEVLSSYCQPLSIGTWLFDNHRAIVHQLDSAGLHERNIRVDPSCTISDVRYHSYRRDKGRSGRMLAFIGMREKP